MHISEFVDQLKINEFDPDTDIYLILWYPDYFCFKEFAKDLHTSEHFKISELYFFVENHPEMFKTFWIKDVFQLSDSLLVIYDLIKLED